LFQSKSTSFCGPSKSRVFVRKFELKSCFTHQNVQSTGAIFSFCDKRFSFLCILFYLFYNNTYQPTEPVIDNDQSFWQKTKCKSENPKKFLTCATTQNFVTNFYVHGTGALRFCKFNFIFFCFFFLFFIIMYSLFLSVPISFSLLVSFSLYFNLFVFLFLPFLSLGISIIIFFLFSLFLVLKRDVPESFIIFAECFWCKKTVFRNGWRILMI